VGKEFPDPLPPKEVKERMDRMVAEWGEKCKVRRSPCSQNTNIFFLFFIINRRNILQHLSKNSSL